MDKALKSVLTWWEASGVEVPDIPSTRRQKAAPKRNLDTHQKSSKQPTGRTPTNRQKTSSSAPLVNSFPIASEAKTLAELELALKTFDAGPLSNRARQSIFARGNPDADVMIIGEAPAKDDEISGLPFTGHEGRLLDKMLAAIGLNEENAYITTVMNWRLPQNRNPKAQEIEICRPFLNRHIELAGPKVLLILGGVALNTLTEHKSVMTHRGQWQSVTIGKKEITALPTYQPATLLKQPALKKEAWRDLQELQQFLQNAS